MKNKAPSPFTAAVVQASPEVLDMAGGVKKTAALTEEAAGKGARLVLFPEAFLPFYPRNISLGIRVGHRTESGRESWEKICQQSVQVPSDTTRELGKIAAANKVYLSMGIMEFDNGSLYCSQLMFGPDGQLAGVHRKIKPTAAERFIWGEGDAKGLHTYDTELGIIGNLICWENYMPLARMTLYKQGLQIHLAPTADNRKTWLHSMQHIASEGRCYVLSCNQYVTQDMYPDWLLEAEGIEKTNEVISAGGSFIAGPDGGVICDPVWDKEEILYAEISIADCLKAKLDLDVAGHYNRPDIFLFETPGVPDKVKIPPSPVKKP